MPDTRLTPEQRADMVKFNAEREKAKREKKERRQIKQAKTIWQQLVALEECPYCSAKNYITDTFDDDCSKMDIEGMKCHACEKTSFFEGVDDFYPDEDLDEISINIQDGKKDFVG